MVYSLHKQQFVFTFEECWSESSKEKENVGYMEYFFFYTMFLQMSIIEGKSLPLDHLMAWNYI